MLDSEADLTTICNARVGSVLHDKWNLEALIGIGGMAAVYAAKHRNGNHKAIKILHPGLSARTDVRNRFLREAYIANAVGHPGAIAVIDDDETHDGCPYLVMDLLIGESVEGVLDRNNGILPVEQVLHVADGALDVLQSAHDNGIVHRDIKPDNLFLTTNGTIIVLDFGIARLRDAATEDRTRTGLVMGTPGFMAPEQVLGRQDEIGPQTDIWSIGALMFKMLSNHKVFEGASDAETLYACGTRPARSLAEVAPHCAPDLIRLVDRALQYDRAQRYPSCNAFQAEIAVFRDTLGQTTFDPGLLLSESPPPASPPVDESLTQYDPGVVPPAPAEAIPSPIPAPPENAPPPEPAALPLSYPAPAPPPPRPAVKAGRPGAAVISAPRSAVISRGRRGSRAPAPPVPTPPPVDRHPPASQLPSPPPPPSRRHPPRTPNPHKPSASAYRATPARSRSRHSSQVPSPPPVPSPPAPPVNRVTPDAFDATMVDAPISTPRRTQAPMRPRFTPASTNPRQALPSRSPAQAPSQPSPPPPKPPPSWSPSASPSPAPLPSPPSRSPSPPPPPPTPPSKPPPSRVSPPAPAPFVPSSGTMTADLLAAATPDPSGGLDAEYSVVDPAVQRIRSLRAKAMTKLQGLKVVSVSPQDTDAVADIWNQLERALISRGQYGTEHPATIQKFKTAFSSIEAALVRSEVGLIWNVTPYSFQIDEKNVWEPTEQFNTIPYRLFAAGIRALMLLPGVERAELDAFLKILTLDPSTEIAPEDDVVTLLWEASFPHVHSLEVDTFAEGDLDSRLDFIKRRRDILAAAAQGNLDQLEDAWMTETGHGDEISTKQGEVLGAVSGEAQLAAAVARATNLNVVDDHAAGQLDHLLAIDPAQRRVLAAQMDMDSLGTSQRFVEVAANAFVAARASGGLERIVKTLDMAVEAIATDHSTMAINFVCRLCEAIGDQVPEEQELLRTELASSIVSTESMAEMIRGLATLSQEAQGAVADRRNRSGPEAPVAGLPDQLGGDFQLLLTWLDARHVAGLLATSTKLPDGSLLDMLIDYVVCHAESREAVIGEFLASARAAIAIRLIRTLARLESQPAREAITEATRNPEPLVRIEAISHLEGVSSARLRKEMMDLLQDNDPEVRLAALKSMTKFDIRAAGPFLVLRIRSKVFPALPGDEKKQAFATVADLAPKRAEKVAAEVLSQTRLLKGSRFEETRAFAAEILGRVGDTRPSMELLREMSTRRWRNSEQVRMSAAHALAQIEDRQEAAP